FINSGSPDNNAGGNGWFDAGTDGGGGVRRGLFRFDLTGIPSGATITAVQLQLTLTRVPGASPVDSTFDVTRMLASWGEGTNSGPAGSLAFTGDATWNARSVGTQNWTTPGALADAAGSPSSRTA